MKRRMFAAALSVALVAGTPAAHAGVERPVDQHSSVKPLAQLSSPGHSSGHVSLATDEQLKEKWEAAVRMGFFTPLIEKIYNLEIGDTTWEERETANQGKYEANEAANTVLGSSLKWDAARGRPLGTALNWWITAGVLAGLLGGVIAASKAGVIQIPAVWDVERLQQIARR